MKHTQLLDHRQFLCWGGLKTLLIASSYLVFSNATATNTHLTPLEPGISVIGLTGSGTTGYADFLAPLFGHATHFLYIDPQAQYHNGQNYTGSLGLGYRKLNEAAGILGAYVFADYNHSSNSHGFWFISPGIERLGDGIDLSANLYIPLGSKRANTETYFASDAGDYKYITFSNHEEYDRLFRHFNSVGVGADAEIGYRIPSFKNNTKVYFGGYYFSPKNAEHITGAAARLQIPLNNYLSLNFSESYDNFAHNTLKGGLTLSFAGRNSHFVYQNHDLSQRLVDPIQRNLVSIAGSSDTAQPIEHSKALTDENGLVLSNISFFAPNGAVDADCTYENRCALNQTNIDNANFLQNNNFFIQSGSYGNAENGLASLSFTNDNVSGRDFSYRKLATFQENNLPSIYFANDGAYLFGNNTLSALHLIQNDIGGLNDALIIATEANTVLSRLNLQGNFILGSSGILISNPADDYVQVLIDHSIIHDFETGIGILDQNLDANSQLNVQIENAILFNNITGINAQNFSGGALNLSLFNSQLSGLNTGTGITLSNTIGSDTFTMINSSISNFGIGYSNLNIQGDSQMFIVNSQITDNISPGILALNSNGKSALTMINADISNNGIGLIADNTSTENFGIFIEYSNFVNNTVGIAIDEFTSVIVKDSIVFNPGEAQIVVGGNGANITVFNPVIFDGLVLNSAGTVIFQGRNNSFEIPPGTGANVQCANGICIVN